MLREKSISGTLSHLGLFYNPLNLPSKFLHLSTQHEAMKRKVFVKNLFPNLRLDFYNVGIDKLVTVYITFLDPNEDIVKKIVKTTRYTNFLSFMVSG